MAGEFVDLYAILDLPVDADRVTVRKRINERYLDAQRNLDHRNFATRVKFQELFEVTLPQARYILLDDGRRDDYNRLVNAFRSPDGIAPEALETSPAPALAQSDEITQSQSGFSLESAPATAPPLAPVDAPAIEPLPQTPVDPAQLAVEREELWKKWKSGLEAALTVDETDKPKSRAAVTTAPTTFLPLTEPEPDASSAPPAPAPKVAIPAAPPVASAPKTARPKVNISFGQQEQVQEAQTPGAAATFLPEVGEPVLTSAEIEARRADRRRQITKEILVNVGLIWGIIGALLILLPGSIALIAVIDHYYPRGAKPLLTQSSMIFWGGGSAVILIAGYFSSTGLSKAMRRRKATQLSLLSYEEVLKQTGKS